MKNKGKNIIGLLMASMLVSNSLSVNYVYAEDGCENVGIVQSTNGETVNLRDNYDEDSVLCDKLEYDKENDITQLSDELEEELNEVGVFDSELEGLDKETINKLENAEIIDVKVDYFTIDDNTGEKKEMSDSEIDDMIEENIEEGDVTYEEEEELITDVLVGLGILPMEVHAAEKKESTSSVSSSGAMKQTLICSQAKAGGKISVTYKATWLDEAYYRNKDVYGVTVSNAVIDNDSWSCKHTATYSFFNFYTGITTETEKSSMPKTYNVGASGSGICYTVNLFGSRKQMNAVAASGAGIEKYKNETITIKFTCKVANKKIKSCTFTSDCFHSQTSKSITPSISIGTGGLSVDVSGTTTNYYSRITNNAYLPYSYI